jgi:hypothetical protein
MLRDLNDNNQRNKLTQYASGGKLFICQSKETKTRLHANWRFQYDFKT